MKPVSLLLLFALMAPASAPAQFRTSANPPAPGFDEAGSDPKAVDLADVVMKAMGGRKAWDNTHLITWNFFGTRRLVWDGQRTH